MKLTREQVLTVLDRSVLGNASPAQLQDTRAAVCELYDEVERLKRAANSVDRLIGGKYTYYKERFGVGHATTKEFSRLIDAIDKERTGEQP